MTAPADRPGATLDTYWDERTHDADVGRYGSYRYRREDDGVEGVYIWAQRVGDYGHRQFATLDEAREYVTHQEGS